MSIVSGVVKPTVNQAKFMSRILNLGGSRVPGSKIFRVNGVVDRREIKTVTIRSCQSRGWVVREERPGDRAALWSVTVEGRTALGVG